MRTHAARSSATHKRSASAALAGTHYAIGADPRAGRGPFPKPRLVVLPIVSFGSCIINVASPFFNGIQDQRAEIPHRS